MPYPGGRAGSDVPVRVRPIGALRCERMAVPEQHDISRIHRGNITYDFSFARSSRSPVPALDCFIPFDQAMARRFARARLVYKHTFDQPRTRPSIARIIAAASVLHDEFPDCIIRSRQCYWFAGALFRMVVGPTDLAPRTRNVKFALAYEHPDGAAKTVHAGRFVNTFRLVTNQSIEGTVAALEDKVMKKEREIEDRLRPLRMQRWGKTPEEIKAEEKRDAVLVMLGEERAAHQRQLAEERRSKEVLERRLQAAEKRAAAAEREAEAAKKALEDARARLANVHHHGVPTSSAPLAG
ncbi:hypothetical protein BV20DRAFT_1051981 [Pilatotrama ljubarskyi]|nr:hypothetical protein BV20DRAFT_1051981 [Pilatotrama ljubarskyi]